MRTRLLGTCLACCVVVASCSAPLRGPEATPSHAPPAAAPAARQEAREIPETLEAYKILFAQRVARLSPDTFDEAPPAMLKSVVVLEVTIDRAGTLSSVSVYRSNGYAALERMALDSVRHAAPFAVPVRVARGRNGSLTFLETFLFRDDGRFRIRSLMDDSR